MRTWALFAVSIPVVGAAGFFAANQLARREIAKKTTAESATPAERLVLVRTVERIVPTAPAPMAEPSKDEPTNPDVEPYLIEPPKDLLRRPTAEIRAYERELQDRVFAELQDHYEHQTVDPVWRAASESRLKATFEAIPLSGVDVGPVDCRGTMCRATLVSKTPEEGQRFVSAFISAFVPGLEHHFHYQDDRITIFSIRHDS